MVDEVDRQLERDAILEEIGVKQICEEAAKIPVGSPGTCKLCSEWSGRLVNKICAPCRDRYKLP